MHCNDAPGAIARLDDMGIAPFLISSSVILACAQRLMRRICPHCKEPVTYPTKMYRGPEHRSRASLKARRFTAAAAANAAKIPVTPAAWPSSKP